MKRLYIFLAIVTILMVVLIAFTFLFFEKEKHKTLFYIVETSGENTGYVKIDYYETEDRIIYKSMSFYPNEINRKIIHEKFIFDRRSFRLERFETENKNYGAVYEAMYIKNNEKRFDFLAKFESKFSILSNVPHAKDISVFNAGSVVTYMPFVDKYNFARGGAQSFNTLYHFINLLPPARGKVIFTSIRDDYIDVDEKKVKTECIVVKWRSIPTTYIWVSKKTKEIVRLEIKDKSLSIKKTMVLPKIVAEGYKITDKTYDSQNVLFPSGDIALVGTIDMPRKEGKLPSVLLIVGEGPYDRENAGIYTDVSHELARNGYIVLRFDKRGIGKSQGINTSVSLTDEMKDIESALRFLLNHEKVDKDRIFVIVHSDACSYLPQLDFSKVPVKGLVMLGVVEPSLFLDLKSEYALDAISALTEINKKYPQNLELLKEETKNLIKSTKMEYAFKHGRRVFVKRMGEILEFKPLEGFKRLDIPLILIYGKKDRFGSPTYINDIEKALSESEHRQFSILYFRDLGHFLGEMITEKNRAKRYKIDNEVLETIKNWINDRCIGVPA